MGRCASAFVKFVQMGELPVSVENHDELRSGIDRIDGVGSHSRELGRFTGVDDHLSLAQYELEAAGEYKQPVMTGMDARFRSLGCWFKSHLDGSGAAGGSTERPDCDAAPTSGSGPDDYVVVLSNVEEGVHLYVECVGESDQDVEADSSFSGLDTTDRRRAEMAAFCKVVERPTACPTQASQSGANGAFNILKSGDAAMMISSCESRKPRCPEWGAGRSVAAMKNHMQPGDWDEHYRNHNHERSSGKPNEVVLAEIARESPGRALDVGCGVGNDAIWLASQGWKVTAVDISQAALDLAAIAADDAKVTVYWECADISTTPPAAGEYDLVSVQYPALRHDPHNEVIRSLLDAVSREGTILFVGHGPESHEYARTQGFEPTDYIEPADVAALLDDTWIIETYETRQRISPSGLGSPFSHDTVLRARRRL
jgi:SAM-dependent methyltransferase